MSLAGVPEVINALRGVKFGVGNRVVKNVLGKHARRIAKEIKASTPVGRSGLLRKSIGAVYRKPKRSSMSAGYYTIGPRRSVQGSALGALDKRENPRTKPSQYAHLVERGRKPVAARFKKVLSSGTAILGRAVAAVRGRPFVAPAAKLAEQRMPEMARDVRLGIASEAIKYAAFGKTIYG